METATLVYRRYLTLEPTRTEEYIAYFNMTCVGCANFTVREPAGEILIQCVCGSAIGQQELGLCSTPRCRVVFGCAASSGTMLHRVHTCEWYSTECALLSSHRTPAPPALIMKPVLVVANCRLRCHGRL